MEKLIDVNFIGVSNGYPQYKQIDTGDVWNDISKSLPCTSKVVLKNAKTGDSFAGKPNFVF